MIAKVIQFPIKEKVIGYKIPLYTDEEIFITISAMNIFSDLQYKITEKNLTEHDPVLVINALMKAKESDVVSGIYKRIIGNILKAVEPVEMRG
jgi:hypothetical protein